MDQQLNPEWSFILCSKRLRACNQFVKNNLRYKFVTFSLALVVTIEPVLDSGKKKGVVNIFYMSEICRR